MHSYYALIRRLVRGDPPYGGAEGAEGGAAVYRTLLRAQQRQVLVQLFGPVRARMGEASFERAVDRVRRSALPCDANPGRWAGSFAATIDADNETDDLTRALASFLALRCEVQLAPNEPWCTGLRPQARLQAFPCDPRVGLTAPEALAATKPHVLAIFRDDAGRVRTPALLSEAVGAWGLAIGETDESYLASAGIDAGAIALGRAQLRTLGLFRS